MDEPSSTDLAVDRGGGDLTEGRTLWTTLEAVEDSCRARSSTSGGARWLTEMSAGSVLIAIYLALSANTGSSL